MPRKVQSPIQHLLGTSKLVFGCLKKRQKSTGVRSKNTMFVKRKIPLPVAEIFRRKDKQWQTRWKLGEPDVLVSAACRVVMLEKPLVTALRKTCSSANVTCRHLFNNSSSCLQSKRHHKRTFPTPILCQKKATKRVHFFSPILLILFLSCSHPQGPLPCPDQCETSIRLPWKLHNL